MSMHEFRGNDHPLFGLDVLVTGGCGQGFRQRMGAKGVRVVATSETNPLEAVIAVVTDSPLPAPAPAPAPQEH
jgi:predicted Fe-Mo cluster-binding NifX family protein